VSRIRSGTLAILFVTLLLVPVALDSIGQDAVSNSYGASQAVTGPVFVWFFGYVGGSFYPQTELDLSQAQMISEAASMSASLGSTTALRFIAAVDQLPGRAATVINWNNATIVANIQSYVSNLSQYGQVYARIDLEEFNWSSSTTVYQEVSNLYKDLGVAGIWFDHAAVVYGSNETDFNTMMQNLTTSYPKLMFILNQSTRSKTGGQVIQPSSGMTWNEQTYISPSVLINSYNKVPTVSLLQQFNRFYPGRVLLHFDSYSQMKDEPMGIFAEQKASVEQTTILTLAEQGASQARKNAGFSLLFPTVGAWTYAGILASGDVNYQGTLYNGLSVGTFARGTVTSFISTMGEYP